MKEFQEIEFAGWVVLVTQHRPEGEGNSEFSFLPQDTGGGVFSHRHLHTAAMSLPPYLRYPGVLWGHVVLLSTRCITCIVTWGISQVCGSQ